jgi:hypothetical protein
MMLRTVAASAAAMFVGVVVHAQAPSVTAAACERLAASLRLLSPMKDGTPAFVGAKFADGRTIGTN